MLVTCFSTARSVMKRRSPIAAFELQHLALTRREPLERVALPAAPDELRDDRRVECRAALRDAPHRGRELLHVRDAVLEQVADTLGALRQQLHRVGRLDVLRQHEHAGRGEALADLLGGAQALVGLRRRHADVHHGHVRLVHGDVAQQVLGRPRLRDDLEARLGEQPGDALAEQHRVVREHYAHVGAEPAERVPEGREVAWQVIDEQLVDRFGIGQPLQAVRAEIGHPQVREERSRLPGHQHLPAVAGRRDPRSTVHVDAGVALVAEHRAAGVNADAHAHPALVRPVVVGQRALRRERRVDGSLHVGEDGEELVPAGFDFVTAGGRDRVAQQPSHVREQPGVVV
jgi:hypothetical protein